MLFLFSPEVKGYVQALATIPLSRLFTVNCPALLHSDIIAEALAAMVRSGWLRGCSSR